MFISSLHGASSLASSNIKPHAIFNPTFQKEKSIEATREDPILTLKAQDLRLLEEAYIKTTDMEVVITKEDKSCTLPQPIFNCLLHASETYVSSSVVSTIDLLLWQIGSTVQKLRCGMLEAANILDNTNELIDKLDTLNGLLGCWFASIRELYEKMDTGASYEEIFDQDDLLYEQNRQNPFSFTFPSLRYIEMEMRLIKDSFSRRFGIKNLRCKSFKEKQIAPLQTLRERLMSEIDALLLVTTTEETMRELGKLSTPYFFRFQPRQTAFFKEYATLFKGFRHARRAMNFAKMDLPLPFQETLEKAFTQLGSPNGKEHFKSILHIRQTLKILLHQKVTLQNSLKAIEQTPSLIFSLYESLSANFQELGNEKDPSPQIDPDQLRALLHDVDLEARRLELLIFQAMDWLVFESNFHFVFNLSYFLRFMSLSQIWQHPQLGTSSFSIRSIPSHLSTKSRKFLVQLCVMQGQRPCLDPFEDEHLKKTTLEIYNKVSSSTTIEGNRLTMVDLCLFFLFFESYLKIDEWVLKGQDLLEELMEDIQKHPTTFSDQELDLLLDTIKSSKVLDSLMVAEWLLEAFHLLVFGYKEPAKVVAQYWLIELENLCRSKRITNKEPLSLNTPTLTNEENFEQNFLEKDEALVTSDTDNEKALSSELSEEEIDEELADLLAEAINIVEQERKKSLFKRQRNSPSFKPTNAQVSPFAASQGCLNETIGITGMHRLDPCLLQRLRDPRKLEKYLKKAGWNLVREGRSHRGFSNGKSEVMMPRHPGQEVSIGVRHQLLKTTSNAGVNPLKK